MKEEICYQDVGMLSNLTRAYLSDDVSVQHLFNLKSSPENMEQLIYQKSNNYSFDRKSLTGIIKSQYKDLKIHNAVIDNIKLLEQENTYTITTGHQLNLFTGPLYFIYKIISVIRTVEDLSDKYPKYNFVPIYWMASEDHDFEEINHTYVLGNKLEWESEQTGMVGKFNTEDVLKVLEDLEQLLDTSIQSEELIERLKRSYLGQDNLADATRSLVNHLFQKWGLVILDGDDQVAKRYFAQVVKDELLNSKSHDLVKNTIESFPKGCTAQVNPREINLFYVHNGIRERILFEEEQYKVNNTTIRFQESEILKELEEYPERFSPNVILRPLYQEMILPNLMYIGGGAEVGYWLELKSTFAYFNVTYPLIQIRSSFVVLSDKTINFIKSYNLKIQDLFLRLEQQQKMILAGEIPLEDDFNRFRSELNSATDELIEKVKEVDKNLIKSAEGSRTIFLKEVKKLEKKILKSVKRKKSDRLNQLDVIRSEMFPGGTFQERRINFADMYIKYGINFLNVIYANTKSFDNKISVVFMK